MKNHKVALPSIGTIRCRGLKSRHDCRLKISPRIQVPLESVLWHAPLVLQPPYQVPLHGFPQRSLSPPFTVCGSPLRELAGIGYRLLWVEQTTTPMIVTRLYPIGFQHPIRFSLANVVHAHEHRFQARRCQYMPGVLISNSRIMQTLPLYICVQLHFFLYSLWLIWFHIRLAEKS